MGSFLLKPFWAVIFSFTLFSAPLYAHYDIGDYVPNFCWANANNKSECLSNYPNTIRVLFFNAGWCRYCCGKMEELSRRAVQYLRKPVVFFSNSVQGWALGSSPPKKKFLQEWEKQYSPPPNVKLVASKMTEIKLFSPFEAIPLFVVLDQNKKITFIENNCKISELFAEVNKLLSYHRPRSLANR